MRHGYKVEARHIDSSWALTPVATPPPGYLAEAKFKRLFYKGLVF